MKAIFSVALLFGACGLAGAAEDKADPVGTWKCAYEIGGTQRTATLMIKKDKDKLAGTMNWPNQKDVKLKDVKMKDGTLSFSALRKVMDMELTVEYTLSIDGDKFKGKAAVEVGGEKREIDIEGKREKSNPVGTWKCEYEIGGNQRTATLMIKKDGDKLAGTMTWPDQDETKVKDLKLKDGTLTFSVVRKFMDNELTVEYKLTVDGDKLKGKGAAEFGGEKREFDIEGKREKKEEEKKDK
jgi:hypothetical protein